MRVNVGRIADSGSQRFEALLTATCAIRSAQQCGRQVGQESSLRQVPHCTSSLFNKCSVRPSSAPRSSTRRKAAATAGGASSQHTVVEVEEGKVQCSRSLPQHGQSLHGGGKKPGPQGDDLLDAARRRDGASKLRERVLSITPHSEPRQSREVGHTADSIALRERQVKALRQSSVTNPALKRGSCRRQLAKRADTNSLGQVRSSIAWLRGTSREGSSCKRTAGRVNPVSNGSAEATHCAPLRHWTLSSLYRNRTLQCAGQMGVDVGTHGTVVGQPWHCTDRHNDSQAQSNRYGWGQ